MRLIINGSVGVGINMVNMFSVIDERNYSAVESMLRGNLRNVAGWTIVQGLDIQRGIIEGYAVACVRAYIKSVSNSTWPMFISMSNGEHIYSGHVLDVLMFVYADCGCDKLLSKAHKAIARNGHIRGWKLCSAVEEHGAVPFIHPLLTLSYTTSDMNGYYKWLSART